MPINNLEFIQENDLKRIMKQEITYPSRLPKQKRLGWNKRKHSKRASFLEQNGVKWINRHLKKKKKIQIPSRREGASVKTGRLKSVKRLNSRSNAVPFPLRRNGNDARHDEGNPCQDGKHINKPIKTEFIMLRRHTQSPLFKKKKKTWEQFPRKKKKQFPKD